MDNEILMIKALFPFKRDEINSIFYFTKHGKAPLNAMEYLFYEQAQLNGFIPLEYMENFNHAQEKAMDKIYSLTRIYDKNDLNHTCVGIKQFFHQFTNIDRYNPFIDYFKKTINGRDEASGEKYAYQVIVNTMIIFQNAVHFNQYPKKNDFINTNHRFLNKKQSSDEKNDSFEAWQMISSYILNRPLETDRFNGPKLLPLIQDMFHASLEYIKHHSNMSQNTLLINNLNLGLSNISEVILGVKKPHEILRTPDVKATIKKEIKPETSEPQDLKTRVKSML